MTGGRLSSFLLNNKRYTVHASLRALAQEVAIGGRPKCGRAKNGMYTLRYSNECERMKRCSVSLRTTF